MMQEEEGGAMYPDGVAAQVQVKGENVEPAGRGDDQRSESAPRQLASRPLSPQGCRENEGPDRERHTVATLPDDSIDFCLMSDY